jgi:hypothetical protein
MKSNDDNMRSFYNFLNNKNHKNQQELKDITIDDDVPMFSLKRPYPIRFISSKLKCALVILNRWATITRTFFVISKDSLKFLASKRDQAASLFKRITDPIFLVHLAFIADISDVFSKASLSFQKDAITVVDQMHVIEKLRTELHKLGTENGKYLKKLLEEMWCNEEPGCTLEQVEDSTVAIKYHGVDLRRLTPEKTVEKSCGTVCKGKTVEGEGSCTTDGDMETNEVCGDTILDIREKEPAEPEDICHVHCKTGVVEVPMLSKARETYIGSLDGELRRYFNSATEQSFEIFSPRMLPAFVSDEEIEVVKENSDDVVEKQNGRFYSECALERLARWFNWDYNARYRNIPFLYREYSDLVKSIIAKPDYEIMKTKGAAEFWRHYHVNREGIEWTPGMTGAVQTAIAVATVTSSAERYLYIFYNTTSVFRIFNTHCETS